MVRTRGDIDTLSRVLLMVTVLVAVLWLGGGFGWLDPPSVDGAIPGGQSWLEDRGIGIADLDDDDAVGVGVSDGGGGAAEVARTEEGTAMERRVYRRVNEIRREHGLAPLKRDPKIASVARGHSEDMYDREYFSHYSPEDQSPGDRLGEVGLFPIHCRTVGENLGYVSFSGELETEGDAERVVEIVIDGWMDSDGHRENLLDEQWETTGIGVYGGDGRVYVTQNFCDERF